MSERDRPLRMSQLLGRRATDHTGRELGTIADLVVEPDDRGRPVVRAALVVRGPWGRLFGYERAEMRGPWVLNRLAGWILHRRTTTVPWAQLRVETAAGPVNPSPLPR